MMKALSVDVVDKLETFAVCKGTWVILAEQCGKYRLVERVSFYEYNDTHYSVIDRLGNRGKTIVYRYDSKDEGNIHFNQIKIETVVIGNLFRRDKRSL